MANTTMTVAHCGACVGPMTLRKAEVGDLWRYVCGRCAFATPWRTTSAAAAEDVLWLTMAQSAAAKRAAGVSAAGVSATG
jgi:hypothetical protein